MDGGGRTKSGTRVEGARGRGYIKSPVLTLPLKGTSPWMDVGRTMQEQLSMELFKKL